MKEPELLQFTPAEIEYYILQMLGRCSKCRHKLELEENVLDTINGIVCEANYLCKHCGSVEDSYSYGNSEAEHDKYNFEVTYPKAAQLIKKIIGVK